MRRGRLEAGIGIDARTVFRHQRVFNDLALHVTAFYECSRGPGSNQLLASLYH